VASLTTSLNTTFTPTAARFRVQVGGLASLVSRNSGSVTNFDPVLHPITLEPLRISGCLEISNIVGCQYQLKGLTVGTTVAVDE